MEVCFQYCDGVGLAKFQGSFTSSNDHGAHNK
jgi:hypothetical protein